jgi:hypothetical protein
MPGSRRDPVGSHQNLTIRGPIGRSSSTQRHVPREEPLRSRGDRSDVIGQSGSNLAGSWIVPCKGRKVPPRGPGNSTRPRGRQKPPLYRNGVLVYARSPNSPSEIGLLFVRFLTKECRNTPAIPFPDGSPDRLASLRDSRQQSIGLRRWGLADGALPPSHAACPAFDPTGLGSDNRSSWRMGHSIAPRTRSSLRNEAPGANPIESALVAATSAGHARPRNGPWRLLTWRNAPGSNIPFRSIHGTSTGWGT